jgi:hypothetical protein
MEEKEAEKAVDWINRGPRPLLAVGTGHWDRQGDSPGAHLAICNSFFGLTEPSGVQVWSSTTFEATNGGRRGPTPKGESS